MQPLVLIPCDVKTYGIHPFHCVGEKYINAVAKGSNALPVLLPALGAGIDQPDLSDHFDLDALLDRVDGVFLPGSASNVHPARYGSTDSAVSPDKQRDTTTFELIARARQRGLPLLAVCRGFQELNVALGGTLHSKVHKISGYQDHREDESQPRENQYGPAHQITIRQDGLLAAMTNSETHQVNSLHSQGIHTLAAEVRLEAVANDGLVEAFSVPGSWALGVQWHPEWMYQKNELSSAIFSGFGDALRAFRLNAGNRE